MEKLNALLLFFKEVRSELQRVSWPSRQEVAKFTSVVIVTTIIVGFYLGLWDFALSQGISFLLAQ